MLRCCLDAFTAQRIALQLSKRSQIYINRSCSTISEESTDLTPGQASKSDEHDEHANNKIDDNRSSANFGSDEISRTDYNGVSTNVNDSDGIIDSDQDKAHRS
jgi:hypothetical protein